MSKEGLLPCAAAKGCLDGTSICIMQNRRSGFNKLFDNLWWGGGDESSTRDRILKYFCVTLFIPFILGEAKMWVAESMDLQ